MNNQELSTPLSRAQYELLKTDYEKFVQDYSDKMNARIKAIESPFRYRWSMVIGQIAVMVLTFFTEKYFKGKSEFLVQLSVWVGILVFIYTLLVQPMLFILYHNGDQKKLKRELASTLQYIEYHKNRMRETGSYADYVRRLAE